MGRKLRIFSDYSCHGLLWRTHMDGFGLTSGLAQIPEYPWGERYYVGLEVGLI